MDKILLSIVILHNMYVESRLNNDGKIDKEDVENNTDVVGSESTPI